MKTPTFETTDLSRPAAACAARRATAQAGARGCWLHAAFAWPGGAVTPRARAMQRALGRCWPPRREGGRTGEGGAWSHGATLQHHWGCCAGGAGWNIFQPVEYFPSFPQTGGALGFIFPSDIIFFLGCTFPPPLWQEAPCRWFAWGSLTRAQLLSSKDVAFRNSWVS